MQQVVIKTLVPADIDKIIEIEQEAFPEPWSRQKFLQELELKFSHFFIARIEPGEIPDNEQYPDFLCLKRKNWGNEMCMGRGINDEVAGYIGLWHVADEGNIVNIAVKKTFRRQGIAKKLLEYVFEFARTKNISGLYLEVRSKNIEAIKLYEFCGFKVNYKRQGYYTDDDAIVMQKRMGTVI